MAATTLVSETIPVAELHESDREGMFRLYEVYYDAADRDRFDHDLAEKSLVIMVRSGGVVAGFSTISVHQQQHDGGRINYLFSGDTVLDSAYWGNPILLRAWFRTAGALKATLREERLFWFTIIMGHRTFRILPNFFRCFVPSVEEPARPELVKIRDEIARGRYGAQFDPRTGLIDFGRSLGHLRQEWATVETTASRNRHAAFFLKANPDHFRGVELACLAELVANNLTRYAAKSFDEGMRHGW